MLVTNTQILIRRFVIARRRSRLDWRMIVSYIYIYMIDRVVRLPDRCER